jgi:hypothetical protein
LLTEEQAVLAAYQAAYDDFNAASASPNDPQLRRNLDGSWTDPILATLVERLDEYVVNDMFTRENPGVEHGYSVRSVSIQDKEAVVITCTIDPWIVVQRTEDGEVVIDSETYVWLERYVVLDVDGAWVVAEGTLIEDLSESGTCDEE